MNITAEEEAGEYLYISTSESYARQNIFKCEGSRSLPPKRNNDLYVCKLVIVPCYREAVDRVISVLEGFTYGANSELIHLRFDKLEEVVDMVLRNFKKEWDFVRARRPSYVKATLNELPTVPSAKIEFSAPAEGEQHQP
jgi:hypothetical protein